MGHGALGVAEDGALAAAAAATAWRRGSGLLSESDSNDVFSEFGTETTSPLFATVTFGIEYGHESCCTLMDALFAVSGTSNAGWK